MNYENDEFYWINFAPVRVCQRGKSPKFIYFQTVGYYYRGEIFRSSPLFPEIMIGNYGTIYDMRGFKIQPSINRGYLTVSTYDATRGFRRNVPVHRLVMLAFDYIDDYEEKEVNHKDGNKTNNYYNPFNPDDPNSNLEWNTHKENMEHAGRTNLIPHKFSGDVVRSLLQLLREGYTQTQAANKLGYDFEADGIHGLLFRVLHEGHYKWVSKDFPDVLESVKTIPQYDFTDEEVETICQMMVEKKSIDDIILFLGDKYRDRDSLTSFLCSLRRNAPRYAHISSKYFQKGVRYSNLPSSHKEDGQQFDESKCGSKIHDEVFIRHVLEKLREGYTKRQAVESFGYEYTKAIQKMLWYMLFNGGYPHITKDYPDVLASAHANRRMCNYEFSIDEVETICQMISSGYSDADIMARMNINDKPEKFSRFLDRLKNNKETKYYLVTSKYFSTNLNNVQGVEYLFTEEEVHKICQMVLAGYAPSHIKQTLNLNVSVEAFAGVVHKIRNNRISMYRHITSQYFK